ncbi:hypothetical protein COLO4_13674 [Corchorus olitorius]|uniref:Uncharacterized protein n=1 Tax=Corchorus olitorius TaxID=93759 RepID=A0A1R3JVC9_9ROSI|nr:hypothetical protein COLO4_13674 [Corchorus olitorius]
MTRALEAEIIEIPPSEWPQILRFYSALSPLSICRLNFRLLNDFIFARGFSVQA